MLTFQCSALPKHAYNADEKNAVALAIDLSADNADDSTLTVYILSKLLGGRLLGNKGLVR